MKLFWLSFLLLLIAQHADFLLQAYQHHWPSWISRSTMAQRAPHIGIFDFLPRDAWHATQFLRNTASWLAPAALALWLPWQWWNLAAVAVLYAITRAIGFSLCKLFFTGRW